MISIDQGNHNTQEAHLVLIVAEHVTLTTKVTSCQIQYVVISE
jgi:hypothetical protein